MIAEDGASVGPAVLGEISQVRGNRIWFIGRGRVEGLNGGTCNISYGVVADFGGRYEYIGL